jgi:hypothetical protein
MEQITYTMDVCEVHMVRSRCRAPPVSHNLTPSRRRIQVDRNHKWCMGSLFAYFDYCWGFQVINSAPFTPDYGYVLSYSQVWLPLCSVDGRIPIESPPV